ncbi:golgi phosphoprotein 3 [Sphaeroforma arctica JP610]|uniref:Golgi phosphoprotein 3 n=1 Tax=Sphaeroforma arctica JP610 TaxID=667725 RepID=A0A0L0G6B5_9EUKA|nr:golgi phosphoprotein 3 [Sphaeroforma arctica JP610]KNC84416.1 golgi phosphoprotein 3 [Sphaeroforma arctica JP610]|eukprot:XP_014158318.1 golgi phosphoprotein 3 [Sphaeroforma arctica JP610]
MSNNRSAGLTQRKRQTSAVNQVNNKPEPERDAFEENDNLHDKYSKDARLSLMEEVLLLGLKDEEGYTSFWNDCISAGLRGCIIVELGLRKRAELEKTGNRRRALLNRKMVLVDETPTGDVLLDETLRHLKDTDVNGEQETVEYWVELLSGETWNPLKLKYQLRNVRERLSKSLVEKGVLTTEKQNFFLFDVTTHPVVEATSKEKVIKRVQDTLLGKWQNDISRIDKRALALVYLAHASDVLENAFKSLSDDDYEIAMRRVRELLNVDPEVEAQRAGAIEPMWAVVETFNSR